MSGGATGAEAVPGGQWELWRQDDNGNRFRIARFASPAEADAEQRRYEALGHKQTYWVERPGPPQNG